MCVVLQYVFVDVRHNAIYTTSDYGAHMLKSNLLFSPGEVRLHPREWAIIAARDPTDPSLRVSRMLTLLTYGPVQV